MSEKCAGMEWMRKMLEWSQWEGHRGGVGRKGKGVGR